MNLTLSVNFEQKQLAGFAELELERARDQSQQSLVLDTRDLDIQSVQSVDREGVASDAPWELGGNDPIFGQPLTVRIPQDVKAVRIYYATATSASGLQWLDPAQTAGKKLPFLFSQNQSIHARSWIPIQDSPGVRFTYRAEITVPRDLQAVMSTPEKDRNDNVFRFSMPYAVPAYLIALAVGDISFADVGPRTGIYAEPSVLSKAAYEFEDLERMLQATEKLYGAYRWGRYDVLVLPPSFPFGGMENPCVTFATPTILAGDKSLVGLISHELAHSWSGNLVTNATWHDFWLNEGFTTYIENRIQEAVYGTEQALMEQVLEFRELEQAFEQLPKSDHVLSIDLAGRDPDEGCTRVPYVRGALLLRAIERIVGRPEFDHFLRDYFDRFAFQSITAEQAIEYMIERLALNRTQERHFEFPGWLTEPALPRGAVKPVCERLTRIASAAKDWNENRRSIADLSVNVWSTAEWLEFLQSLPVPLRTEQVTELDDAFHLTDSDNYEILAQWFEMCVQANYKVAYPRIEQFLLHVGRMKMIVPLYRALLHAEGGATLAKSIYERARANYHPIAQTAVERLFHRGVAPPT